MSTFSALNQRQLQLCMDEFYSSASRKNMDIGMQRLFDNLHEIQNVFHHHLSKKYPAEVVNEAWTRIIAHHLALVLFKYVTSKEDLSIKIDAIKNIDIKELNAHYRRLKEQNYG